MAYRGLATLVIARRVIAPDVRYVDGTACGRAIKVELEPIYEDVGDYGDINDTDEESAFAYANVKLNTAELPVEAEWLMYGRKEENGVVVSRDTDKSNELGFGMRIRQIIRGDGRYIAVWLHCVRFKEDARENTTRKDEMIYDTENLIGKAVPDESGTWRTKKIFGTSEEADSWLKSMAGMK